MLGTKGEDQQKNTLEAEINILPMKVEFSSMEFHHSISIGPSTSVQIAFPGQPMGLGLMGRFDMIRFDTSIGEIESKSSCYHRTEIVSSEPSSHRCDIEL